METSQNKWEFATLASYEQFIFQLLGQEELIADPLLDWEDALLDNNLLIRQASY